MPTQTNDEYLNQSLHYGHITYPIPSPEFAFLPFLLNLYFVLAFSGTK
jgi:hypothetical protein